MWHQGGEDARSTDFTKDRPRASTKRRENTLGNNTLWKQHVGKYTFGKYTFKKYTDENTHFLGK